jgi:hypothetical protein
MRRVTELEGNPFAMELPAIRTPSRSSMGTRMQLHISAKGKDVSRHRDGGRYRPPIVWAPRCARSRQSYPSRDSASTSGRTRHRQSLAGMAQDLYASITARRGQRSFWCGPRVYLTTAKKFESDENGHVKAVIWSISSGAGTTKANSSPRTFREPNAWVPRSWCCWPWIPRTGTALAGRALGRT